MCKGDDSYNELPMLTIGGPTGDYSLTCPITSCKWAEFSIVGISNGDGAGAASIVISGNRAPKAVKYDGSDTLSDQTYLRGMPFRITATQQAQSLPTEWDRITNSEKKVFARIDCAGGSSVYITLRFRVKILDRVPGPATTTHPDTMHKINEARADAVRERLGMNKEIAEGEGLNARR